MCNFGLLLAAVHGILPRALDPFPLARLIWQEGERQASSTTTPLRLARTTLG
jgi:hypothetical protein